MGVYLVETSEIGLWTGRVDPPEFRPADEFVFRPRHALAPLRKPCGLAWLGDGQLEEGRILPDKPAQRAPERRRDAGACGGTAGVFAAGVAAGVRGVLRFSTALGRVARGEGAGSSSASAGCSSETGFCRRPLVFAGVAIPAFGAAGWTGAFGFAAPSRRIRFGCGVARSAAPT